MARLLSPAHFIPDELLSALYGTNAQGVWQLEINDNTASTTGTLNSWSLEITTGDPNTTTAANGMYTLANLPPASHKIREVLQAPYLQTAPPGGFYTVSVTAGGFATGRDFGNQAPTSATPTRRCALLAASDTGSSNSDHITKLNNSSPASVLQFQVSGTIAGATVTLFADGNPIGSALASGPTTIVTTDGLLAHDLARRRSLDYCPTDRTIQGVVRRLARAGDYGRHDCAHGRHRAGLARPAHDSRGQHWDQLQRSRERAGPEPAEADSATRRSDLLSGAQTVSSGDSILWTLANLATIDQPRWIL